MNEVVHTSPTIGSNVEEIVVNNTHFLMWDIGGQESLRSSWNTYYTNTEVGSSAGSLAEIVLESHASACEMYMYFLLLVIAKIALFTLTSFLKL